MQRLLFNGKYIIAGSILTILNLLSLNRWQSANAGTVVFLLYAVFFGFYLGQFFLPRETRGWKIFFGLIGLAGLFAIPLTAVYWFYQINANIITIFIILIPFIIGLQKEKEKDIFANIEAIVDPNSYIHVRSYLSTKIWILIFLLGEISMFSSLFGKQFDDTLISPWTIIGPKFFLLFAFNTVILLWILQKSKHSFTNLFLTLAHSVLTMSIALIIFKLGFGFDPFIHQAAEKWIAEHGAIFPKQPYYIGQYMLVLIMHFITHLPINYLDKLLVPLSAGLGIPLVSYFAFTRTGYADKIYPALPLIFFIPMVFFIMTTPNNLALLLSLILFFWIWYENKNVTLMTRCFGLLAAFLACAIHPFIGLPILVIYLGSITLPLVGGDKEGVQVKTTNPTVPTSPSGHLPYKGRSYIFYPIYFLLLTITLPLTFYINSLRLGEKLALKNPFLHLADFINIFSRPYWFWVEKGNIFWRLLYYYRDLIKPLAVAIIIVGLIIAIKKYHEKIAHFYWLSALGLALSALVISTSINFPNVISYEQKAYGMRLMELALVMLFLFFIMAVREFFISIRRKPGKQFLAGICLSVLLLISWYFTYPTRDPVSFYTGYNIRRADILAVHFIDNLNSGIKDYIVLTNQTVATAALREFGFAKYFSTTQGEQYFYSIPTGGPLYQYFRKMVYEVPKKKWVKEAMDFMGVQKAYFVHTNYWAPAAEIRDRAKLEADRWWELGDGRVWVYEYVLKN